MANHLYRLAFIDETSLKTNMAKTTGWAPCGQRLVDNAPFGHWRTQTFIGALRHVRLDAPWVIDGAMNGEMFTLYTQTQLVPTLQKGDVVILDNLSSHKALAAAEALRAIGAWFLFLPPYSPDLNPTSRCMLRIYLPGNDRNGLRQAQGAHPQSCRENLRPTLGRRRTRLQPLLRRRVLQLPQGCGI